MQCRLHIEKNMKAICVDNCLIEFTRCLIKRYAHYNDIKSKFICFGFFFQFLLNSWLYELQNHLMTQSMCHVSQKAFIPNQKPQCPSLKQENTVELKSMALLHEWLWLMDCLTPPYTKYFTIKIWQRKPTSSACFQFHIWIMKSRIWSSIIQVRFSCFTSRHNTVLICALYRVFVYCTICICPEGNLFQMKIYSNV